MHVFGRFGGFSDCGHASDPRPPHTRRKYEQKSARNMAQNASKQGKLDSLAAIYLFIFLPCMWGLGFQNDSPFFVGAASGGVEFVRFR